MEIVYAAFVAAYLLSSLISQNCCAFKICSSSSPRIMRSFSRGRIRSLNIRATNVLFAKRPKLSKISELSESEAASELRSLNEEINLHDDLYYNKNEPLISDAAYDKLVRRAENIAGRFNHLANLVEKLNRVGGQRNQQLLASLHTIPMLSLENSFTSSEVAQFCEKSAKVVLASNKSANVDYVVEPKIDGLSLSLCYVDGKLVHASTRGDGKVGENVTANALVVQDIPHALQLSKLTGEINAHLVEVRGEVYLSAADFKALNEARHIQNQSLFSTPRNAAAGSLRQLDPKIVRDRQLRFFAYSLLFPKEFPFNQQRPSPGRDETLVVASNATSLASRQPYSECPSQYNTLRILTEMGFRVAAPSYLCHNQQEVWDRCVDMERIRPTLDYAIDGAVVKVDSTSQQQQIGFGRRFPKWATAFKFGEEGKETDLLDVIIQVGRTGLLSPVAVLKPVNISGVVVERATLHNEKEVRRLGLQKYCQQLPRSSPRNENETALGQGPRIRVIVKRAGDVIPKIVSAQQEDNKNGCKAADCLDDECSGDELSLLFSVCPVCGSPTERDSGGVLVRCTGGISCSAQVVEQMKHFCSKECCDIVGLGPSRLDQLYRDGVIHDVVDIFHLRKMDQQGNQSTTFKSLRGRTGWGDISVNKLLSAIDTSRNITFPKLLFGLGIRHIGISVAEVIARHFSSFGEFWSYLTTQSDQLLNAASSSTTTENEKRVDIRSRCSSILQATFRQSKKLSAKAGDCDRIGDRLLRIHGLGIQGCTALLLFALPGSSSRDQVNRLLPELEVSNPFHQSLSSGSSRAEEPSNSDLRQLQNISGKKIVFTGALQRMKRSDAEELCKKHGALVEKRITKGTDILVIANSALVGEETSKSRAARERGIQVYTEEDWEQFVRQMDDLK